MKLKKILTLLLVGATLITTTVFALNDQPSSKQLIGYNYYKPFYKEAYNPYNDISGYYEYSNWMANIEDNQRIMTLSIPGTHDTMAFRYKNTIITNNEKARNKIYTQSLPLEKQLQVGVRYLDIRAKLKNDRLDIYHSIAYLETDLDTVISTIDFYFRDHPGEFVLMRLKNEEGNNHDAFEQIFLSRYYNSIEFGDMFYKGKADENTTIGEVRGKIVLLRNFNSAGGIDGYSYNDQYIQDDYEFDNEEGLYSKYKTARGFLNSTKNHGDNIDGFYLNHLSATGANWSDSLYPWFFASGFKGKFDSTYKDTGIPSSSSDYADWPREEGIRFVGSNMMINDMIKRDNIFHSGIVIADFIGPDLIHSIISGNRTKSNYPVQYKDNFGASNMPQSTANIYKTRDYYTLSNQVPKREGYTFKGWKYAGDNYAYYNKVFPPGTTKFGIKGKTIFETTWEINQYTILYQGESDVEGIPEKVEVKTYGSDAQITYAIPFKKGYSFLGWEFNGKLYRAGDTFKMPAENVAFNAKFERQDNGVMYFEEAGKSAPSTWIYIGE